MLSRFLDIRDIFHTEMVIGEKRHVYLRSRYQNFLSGLENKIIICGSFHVHSHKKYINSYANSEFVDKNRLSYIKECCRSCPSLNDLETILANIVKRDSRCRITCILSDIEDQVSYYIPKKHISIEDFKNTYNRLKEDLQVQIYTETIDTLEGPMSFPTPEYRKVYEHVFGLFDENKFDLHSEETIIDI